MRLGRHGRVDAHEDVNARPSRPRRGGQNSGILWRLEADPRKRRAIRRAARSGDEIGVALADPLEDDAIRCRAGTLGECHFTARNGTGDETLGQDLAYQPGQRVCLQRVQAQPWSRKRVGDGTRVGAQPWQVIEIERRAEAFGGFGVGGQHPVHGGLDARVSRPSRTGRWGFLTTVDRPMISPLDEQQPGVPDIVIVGGAGHVGLPLSLVFCDAGFRVGILDTSHQSLTSIASGRAPFAEPGADELIERLAATGRLTFSASPDVVRGVDTVIVAVGLTDDEGSSSVAALDQTIDGLAAYLADGALLIIRSTVRPGTTDHVRQRLRERGMHADVAFCPERLVQGNALEELRSLPQIVGADDPQAASRAEALFGRLGIECLRSTALEAEVAKLVANGWRYVSFAAANEFWALADAAGADYDNVLRIVQQDYPRARNLPSPGFAAGPCLVKDSVALAELSSRDGSLVRAALEINRSLPARVAERMERRFGPLAGRHVGLLGMAFKAGSDDVRGAPSTELRQLLIDAGAIVRSTDPYVRDPANLPIAEVLEHSEVFVVATPHPDYRDIAIPADRLVDIWGITRAGIVA